MIKIAQHWLERIMLSLSSTQKDKHEHSEASFPYHNGVTKVYYQQPKTDEK